MKKSASKASRANRRTDEPADRLHYLPLTGEKRCVPSIFKRPAWRKRRPPARLTVDFADAAHKEPISAQAHRKVNPDWVTAPYEIEFRGAPGVFIGPPPDTLADSS